MYSLFYSELVWLVNLTELLKEPAFDFIDFLYSFSVSLISTPVFIISILSLTLSFFFCSFPPWFLRWKLRSLISGLYFFPVQILSLYVLYCFSCMSVFLYVVFSFSFNSKYSHFPFDLFFDPGVIEKYVL